jgi:hypothetical protein
MKALLVALLCAAATNAQANDLFYSPNQAGGAIVLTDVVGQCQGSMMYYTTDAGGVIHPMGCWTYDNPWVKAREFNGTQHQWMADGFIPTQYAKDHLKN